MTLRTVLWWIAIAALLCASALAKAQSPGKTHRVGLLTVGTDSKNPVRMNPFFDAMRELNYVEGRNLVVTRGYGDGKFARLPALIDEMVRAKVEVIVTSGNREILALRKANVSLPIVMMFVDDPVAEGFVQSLARPGGNITGLTNLVPGLSQKYVELLREVLPKADRFAVVHSPPLPRPHMRKDLEAAAQALKTALSIVQVSGPDEYDGAFAGTLRSGADGIIAPMDGNTFANRKDLVGAALKHKLPAIYGDRGYVDAGGLMSYSAPQTHRLQRAAVYVDKILRGAKPADLPVEQPTRFELVINMKTAKALGVTIPRSLLVRADEVIE
jgi:putative ABC transport system substrate-binding protein